MSSALDLNKIPFFQFFLSFLAINLAYGFGNYLLSWIPFFKPYTFGFWVGLGLQGGISLLKVFYMNRDWSSPPTIQMFLNLASFFSSLAVLIFFTVLRKDISFMVGFFIAYYINIKNIVLIAHFYSRNENDE
ncbi:MAG: hypothetical protein SFU98_11835 [Leptospiraceae bacterium]|nr:hypothetical protein [Leptospiraceae bacterium]